MKNLNFLIPVSLRNKIRLGPNMDGGYVLYEPALKNVDLLLSYGVGWDINFEVDFYNLAEKKILMFDPTMFGDSYINKPYCMSLLKHGYFISAIKYLRHIYHWKKELQRLEEYGIKFFNEGIADKVYHKYDTFKNQLCKNGITSEQILLKMDIEGHEYAIFRDQDFLNSLNLVDQMIIEFHNLKSKLRELQEIIHKLSEQYYIIHIHGNNATRGFIIYRDSSDLYFPDIVELTFLRKTSVFSEDIVSDVFCYPDLVLDYPNVPYNSDFERLVFG